jgi:hypothetical protein
MAGQVEGLQHDNGDDTLYALYSGRGGVSMSWIDPSSGALHPMAVLPSLSLPYLNAYTIDETSGRYIFLGMDLSSPACISNYLYVLDINTGAVITKTLYPYAQSATVIRDQNLIEYIFDNKRGTLYDDWWHPKLIPGYKKLPAVI